LHLRCAVILQFTPKSLQTHRFSSRRTNRGTRRERRPRL
jgi:hypothetical protein